MKGYNSFIKNSLKFIGLIVLTQLAYLLIDAYWHVFYQSVLPADPYIKTAYLSDLKIKLIASYVLAIGIKGFQLSRTWGFKPLTVIDRGITINEKSKNPYGWMVLALIVSVFIFFQIQEVTLAEILWGYVASVLTLLTPTFAFLNTGTLFYKDCFSHKNKLYFANDLSDVYEEDDVDSERTIFSFKHLNTVHQLSVSIEHLNPIRAHFKQYLNASNDESTFMNHRP